ncbi:kinesin-like protein KIN-7F [Rutidosis leptorrhynchoides]|uniref:kinesin-like protein KIN-7F n=1 Tax=Rutidosis leptorrhynchoides TaxID=125765 RepID=UPI003A98FC96
MRSLSSEEIYLGDGGAQDEKICVSVRLRPMNAKEIAKNDFCDWECVNNNTIIYRNVQTERSTHPNAYTFDRVYGMDSTTKEVYEEGAKHVALSVLDGINSSIFAYGQTSSGKTYTMTGITQFAISDIFEQINKQIEREFVLKFSAIEIYNECVRDLLSADTTPLRLLDDPEKGTVVDKLTEIHLEDWTHLMELLAVCEAQRRIGETSLNEMSSRSHQIIRLTIESTANEFSGIDSASTLTATVNFVDLAGSERASQTLSAGTRLKEGGHINRSLLTLGTVIRKLSKGRNGHVPYRDSKLTRILQNSLGGNARTAIICTLSPAHAHLEQSRNTLLFAACAKEVRTNAQVNVVMSEKALVKQLQREMARLENELRNMSGSTTESDAIIQEKELQIQKMEKEIKDLTQERDLARTHLEEILKAAGVDQNSVPLVRYLSRYTNNLKQEQTHTQYGHSVFHNLRSTSWDRHSDTSELAADATHSTSEAAEVAADVPDATSDEPPQAIGSVNTYAFPKNHKLHNPNEDHYSFDNITPREFMNQYFGPEPTSQKTRTCTKLGETCNEGERTKNDEADDDEDDSHNQNQDVDDAEDDQEGKSSPSFKKTTSCSAMVEGIANLVTENNVMVESKSDSDLKKLCRQDSQKSSMNVDEKEKQQTEKEKIIKTLEKLMQEDIRGLYNNYMGTPKAGDFGTGRFDSDKDWSLVFEEQRKKIIELWNECNIPLLHRTYFFLLIKGDPSDSVYIEVELRRLFFLKKTLDQIGSARALNLERAMLARKLLSKYTAKERETLFEKWGIDLESRNRRYQLAQLFWTKTDDIEHITESAEVVAKLVGLIEPSKTPKEEMFALSVAPKQESRSLLSTWRDSLTLLRG